MINRETLFWYPRFVTTAVTIVGLLGTFMLVPGRIADPWLPSIKKAEPKRTSIVFSVPTQFQKQIVRQGNIKGSDKPIALTIDDGPWGDMTLKMLNVLREHNAKATFFWIGKNVQTYPEIARQVVAQGHAIGNHTWHHWYFRMTQAMAAAEIENTNRVIYETTGVKTSMFRPPGGFLNNGLVSYARSQNQAIMLWSTEPGEFRRANTVSNYINNVLKEAKPGGIVLMHDGGGNHVKTLAALPQIITELKKRGYRFVTIPELLSIQAQNSQKPESSETQATQIPDTPEVDPHQVPQIPEVEQRTRD